MRAINLNDERELIFDENTTELWAVSYGYCQDKNLLSALCHAANSLQFESFAETLPIVKGNKTIACGDWCAITDQPSDQPND